MLVSVECPSSTAHALAPLPRCSVIIRSSARLRPMPSRRRPATYSCDVPWKSVAADAFALGDLLIDRVRARPARQAHVKCGVEHGDVRNGPSALPRGTDAGEIVRIVQRRERHAGGDRGFDRCRRSPQPGGNRFRHARPDGRRIDRDSAAALEDLRERLLVRDPWPMRSIFPSSSRASFPDR
jgi:hypothetical protein